MAKPNLTKYIYIYIFHIQFLTRMKLEVVRGFTLYLFLFVAQTSFNQFNEIV